MLFIADYLPTSSAPFSSTAYPPPPMKETPISTLVSGQWFTATIAPMALWRGKLMVRQPAHYQMNLTFVGGASTEGNVAVYGRQGALPSITNYDWVHMVREDGSSKLVSKRSVDFGGSGIKVSKLLNRGQWYISILNDDSHPRTMRMMIGQRRRGSVCPKDCNGQGLCDDGKCKCFPQFSGLDCSESKSQSN